MSSRQQIVDSRGVLAKHCGTGWTLYTGASHTQPTCTTCTIAHTHTHPFNGSFSGTTQVSRYQKGKTNLDFTEARDSEWQWHQLGHMQASTLLQTDNHTSTPPLSFLQAGCPSCRPTNSVKALKEKTCTIAQRPFFNYWLQPLFFAIVLNWWSMPDKCKPQTAVNVHCTQCTQATHYQITENFLYNYQIYVSNNKSLSVTVLQSYCKECIVLSLGYWTVKRLFWKCSRLAFKKPCLKKFRKIRPVK